MYNISDEKLTYDAMLPLHNMWLQYFTAGVIDGSRNPELVLARVLKVRYRCDRCALAGCPPPLTCLFRPIFTARGCTSSRRPRRSWLD